MDLSRGTVTKKKFGQSVVRTYIVQNYHLFRTTLCVGHKNKLGRFSEKLCHSQTHSTIEMSTAKRAVDEDAATSEAKSVHVEDYTKETAPIVPLERVCCTECGRKYAGPLDLPLVVITEVTATFPAAVERSNGYCSTHNGASSLDYFLQSLSEQDQAKLRALCSAPVTEIHRVPVTTTDGRTGTCVVQSSAVLNREPRHFLELFIDVMPSLSPVMEEAKTCNPFVVDSTPISVREVWGVSTDHLAYAETNFLWLHRTESRSESYYFGVCKLHFVTSVSGCFEVALIGNGPNMGSAGGPTTDYLAPLYLINFTLASAVSAGDD